MLFKIRYVSSGRYKSTLIGRIQRWEAGEIHIMCQAKKYYTLSEKAVLRIEPMEKPENSTSEREIVNSTQVSLDDVLGSL